MIIKIENLPEGQKIKHISVDVEFDDAGNVESVNPTFRNSPVESIVNTPIQTVEKPNVIDRQPKEIPKEMLEMEL